MYYLIPLVCTYLIVVYTILRCIFQVETFQNMMQELLESVFKVVYNNSYWITFDQPQFSVPIHCVDFFIGIDLLSFS